MNILHYEDYVNESWARVAIGTAGGIVALKLASNYKKQQRAKMTLAIKIINIEHPNLKKDDINKYREMRNKLASKSLDYLQKRYDRIKKA